MQEGQQPKAPTADEAQVATNSDNPTPDTAAPSKSTSLYVGDLHPDVTEALLYDIFNAVGPVASLRVCRDAVTRRSLGYAYVNFQNATAAERALETMNYTTIKDRPCRIMWSHRDPSLRKTGEGNVFVKHLELSIDNKALYDTFSLFGNILSCKVVTDAKGKSRGYGFVHFETTEAADEAIKKINGMLLAGKEVYVGKFLKKNDRPSAKDWTNVYVKNIPREWSREKLTEVFSECGAVASAIVMVDEEGVNRGFGFVDFVEHEAAVAAIEKFNGYEPDGVSKPEEADKENGVQQNVAPTEPKEKEDADKNEIEGEEAEAKEPETPVSPTALVVCKAQKKIERERELSKKFEQLKLDRQNKYQGVNLYIKNLDDAVDDDTLRNEFAEFGTITSARVMREKTSFGQEGKKLGASKGFGFVCFSAHEEAMRAVAAMNGRIILGKPIYVALAQRKDQRRAQLEAQHRNQQRMLAVPGMGAQPGLFPYNAGNPLGAMNNMGMNPMGLGNAQQMNRFNAPHMPMMNPMGMMRGHGPESGPRGMPQQFPNHMGRPNMQFNANARNTQMPMQSGVNLMRGGIPENVMASGVDPNIDQPLTAEALAQATQKQRKAMIGEKLYPMVQSLEPTYAAKVTGMLLEMENNELLHLLESPDALRGQVREAMDVLKSSR